MRIVHDAKRRAFLQALATSGAALAVGACSGSAVTTTANTGGGGGVGGGGGGGTPPPPGVNLAPVWSSVPTVSFTQGVASTFSVAAFVSDPNGDALTLTRNAVALPVGVTFDAANKRFVYDGIGALGSTNNVVLTADDGKP